MKANVRQENFEAGRQTLGLVLHTLQVRIILLLNLYFVSFPSFFIWMVAPFWREETMVVLQIITYYIFCTLRTSTATVTGWSWGTLLLTAL